MRIELKKMTLFSVFNFYFNQRKVVWIKLNWTVSLGCWLLVQSWNVGSLSFNILILQKQKMPSLNSRKTSSRRRSRLYRQLQRDGLNGGSARFLFTTQTSLTSEFDRWENRLYCSNYLLDLIVINIHNSDSENSAYVILWRPDWNH